MSSSRERRRGVLRATLTALPAFAILLGLAAWQLERREWKHALVAEMNAALAAPPLGALGPGAAPFRRAALRGAFLNDKEMRLEGWPRDGQVGAEIITPFRVEDGGFVIVDRGWVPLVRRDPATRAAGLIEGETVVEGVLRAPVHPNMFAAANRPERGEWHHVDPPAMARRAGLDPARTAGLYLVAGPGSPPGGWPKARPARIDLPDNHLQYAITWFALAGVLAVVYAVYVRRTLREERQ